MDLYVRVGYFLFNLLIFFYFLVQWVEVSKVMYYRPNQPVSTCVITPPYGSMSLSLVNTKQNDMTKLVDIVITFFKILVLSLEKSGVGKIKLRNYGFNKKTSF